MTAKGSNGRNIAVKMTISVTNGAVVNRLFEFSLRASARLSGLVSGGRAEVVTSSSRI